MYMYYIQHLLMIHYLCEWVGVYLFSPPTRYFIVVQTNWHLHVCTHVHVIISISLPYMFIMFFSCSNQQVYTSYTPIHRLVRRGLQIDCNNIHNTDTSNMKTNSNFHSTTWRETQRRLQVRKIDVHILDSYRIYYNVLASRLNDGSALSDLYQPNIYVIHIDI